MSLKHAVAEFKNHDLGQIGLLKIAKQKIGFERALRFVQRLNNHRLAYRNGELVRASVTGEPTFCTFGL